MKLEGIPVYVRELYAYFGIAPEHFEEHYKQDCRVRGAIRANVAELYKKIHRDLQREGVFKWRSL